MVRCPGSQPMHILLRHLSQKQELQLCAFLVDKTSLCVCLKLREFVSKIYYAFSSGFKCLIADLQSLEILLCVLTKFLKIIRVFSGPDVSPNSSLCTAFSQLNDVGM